MKSRYAIILLFVIFSFLSLDAKHILGGSANYRVTGQSATASTLSIEFVIIRNAQGGGASFDSPAQFGIYGFKNNQYTYLAIASTNPSSIELLDLEYPDSCPELSYETGVYSFDVSLPNSTYDSYVISHQRCCRDNGLSNISNPEESGLALSITIYPKAFEFIEKAREIPMSSIPFLLNNMDEHTLDLSIDDPYTKEYLLTTPSTAGGTSGVTFGDPEACDGIVPNPQNCLPPYGIVDFKDDANPYGLGADVSLDKENGDFIVDIPTVGINLFEITINRFDNGELLSSVNSQWTTTISTCEEALNINELSSNQSIQLAPNPALNTIYTSDLLRNIVVFDPLGNKVMTIDKMDATEEISITKLSAGLYFLNATAENGEIVNLQFVKSR